MSFKVDKIVKELCDWLKENDFDIESKSSLRLIQSENIFEGRCVLSNKNFEPNSILIEFPHQFLINYRQSFKIQSLIEFFEWYYENYLKKNNLENHLKLSRLDALYLLILEQRFNPNSHLTKFINSMPQNYDTPEYFDKVIINNLPQYWKFDIEKRIDRFNLKFNFVKNLLTEFSKISTNKTIENLVQNFNKENFRWVFCSVNSRCFHAKETEICDQDDIVLANKYFGVLNESDGELNRSINCNSMEEYEELNEKSEEIRNNLCCIIPYLDFLNHSNDSNAYAVFNECDKSYILKSQEQSDFSETKLVNKDEQVYITYGHHDNKTLYIEYGFILEDNIYDKITFNFRDLKKLVQTDENSEKFIWQCAIQKNLINDLSCNKQEGPSWSLLKLLDLIHIFNDDFKLLNSKQSKKSKNSNLELNFYDIQNFNFVKELFLKILSNYKKDFIGSLDRLNALSVNLKDTYHFKMSKRLVELYLEIIEFNNNLANDEERWVMLF